VALDPDSPHGQVYRAIAQRVWDRLSGGPARAAPRIVVE
jgi:ATP-binding protein involved in chromosome partitioning